MPAEGLTPPCKPLSGCAAGPLAAIRHLLLLTGDTQDGSVSSSLSWSAGPRFGVPSSRKACLGKMLPHAIIAIGYSTALPRRQRERERGILLCDAGCGFILLVLPGMSWVKIAVSRVGVSDRGQLPQERSWNYRFGPPASHKKAISPWIPEAYRPCRLAPSWRSGRFPALPYPPRRQG